MTSTALITRLSFYAFWMAISAISFTLIRYVPTDINETQITYTNSTVVLDGIILGTLHEEKTSANSRNVGYVSETILFRQEFSTSKSSVEPLTKDFVISCVDIENRPAEIQTYSEHAGTLYNVEQLQCLLPKSIHFSSFCNFLPTKYFPYWYSCRFR